MAHDLVSHVHPVWGSRLMNDLMVIGYNSGLKSRLTTEKVNILLKLNLKYFTQSLWSETDILSAIIKIIG